MRLTSIIACMAVGVSYVLTAQAQQSTPAASPPAASPPAEDEYPAHPLPRPAAVIAPPPGQSKDSPAPIRHKHSAKVVGGTGQAKEPTQPASSSNTPPPK
jgi:hypothetical protein